ncbi:hypothetical protein JTE90_004006 [Oedothorax gibbosus]|uniref:Zinc finger protein n=1 Tax=Oedothorax gibbosus TaxID=931172 RepID=A0AAV6U696_9ARAC|nr:hypothetical protein JTE90_004006 [Oedothorax gibbosus]
MVRKPNRGNMNRACGRIPVAAPSARTPSSGVFGGFEPLVLSADTDEPTRKRIHSGVESYKKHFLKAHSDVHLGRVNFSCTKCDVSYPFMSSMLKLDERGTAQCKSHAPRPKKASHSTRPSGVAAGARARPGRLAAGTGGSHSRSPLSTSLAGASPRAPSPVIPGKTPPICAAGSAGSPALVNLPSPVPSPRAVRHEDNAHVYPALLLPVLSAVCLPLDLPAGGSPLPDLDPGRVGRSDTGTSSLRDPPLVPPRLELSAEGPTLIDLLDHAGTQAPFVYLPADHPFSSSFDVPSPLHDCPNPAGTPGAGTCADLGIHSDVPTSPFMPDVGLSATTHHDCPGRAGAIDAGPAASYVPLTITPAAVPPCGHTTDWPLLDASPGHAGSAGTGTPLALFVNLPADHPLSCPSDGASLRLDCPDPAGTPDAGTYAGLGIHSDVPTSPCMPDGGLFVTTHRDCPGRAGAIDAGPAAPIVPVNITPTVPPCGHTADWPLSDACPGHAGSAGTGTPPMTPVPVGLLTTCGRLPCFPPLVPLSAISALVHDPAASGGRGPTPLPTLTGTSPP